MKLNVIWILVEGMRNFYTEDGYSRAKSIELIANEGIEFADIITSAPSTLMSFSAMFSGMPAYYQAANYHEGVFDKRKTLIPILEENGYDIKSVLWHEYIIKLFGCLKPVGLPSDKKIPETPGNPKNGNWWPADIINQAALKLLDNELKEPFFFFLAYPPTGRLNTDQDIGDFLSTLKTMDLYNHSLIIISSDHGLFYPIPPREIWEKKMHDKWVDESSIHPTFIIRHPSFSIKRKVDQVTSTIDILPTILDFLDIDFTRYKTLSVKGKSLRPLIEEKEIEGERMVRVDTRYLFQPERITVVRGNRFKYIICHDEKKEGFFDIKNDPEEKNDLINSSDNSLQDVIQRYREEFKSSEDEAIRFIKESAQREIIQKCQDVNLSDKRLEVIIFRSSRIFHLEFILEIIKDLSPKIDVFIQQNISKDFKNSQFVRGFIDWNKEDFNYAKFKEFYPDLMDKKYDIVIVPVNDLKEGYEEVFKIARCLSRGSIISIDYNMGVRKEEK